MKLLLRTLVIISSIVLTGLDSSAQLTITPAITAQALAQKLVGDGVSISNVTFTGNLQMTGFFVNAGNNAIGIDSGIVLTTGAADTVSSGGGAGVSANSSVLANKQWGLPGDATLAGAIGVPLSELEDACVLEFDFVPLGDTVRFKYVFSSEEYTPAFVCDFNDAFGFFISGPGITGLQNIALVPNTSTPVSILNVNNVQDFLGPLCPNNISYYIDNNSTTFSHDGHTVVLTAVAAVQPCQSYHLKLVISDNADDQYDSGVFLEAKSLSSNAVALINNTQVSQQGESYLVEGCIAGSFTIRRPLVTPLPLVVNLIYSGTAVNGVDVQTMPSTVTIPANQAEVTVDIFPIIDNLPEGIEFVKVFSVASCASSTALPIDSTVFQIRDYDTLGVGLASGPLVGQDSVYICRNTPTQLTASGSFATYQWSPAAGLNDPNIRNPMATPTSQFTKYIATADLGTCHARDSIFLEWKVPELISTLDVNCNGGTTGQAIASGGAEWDFPVTYSIDGLPYQSSGTFNNLTVGTHSIRVRDASGCVDSIPATLIQAFPTLVITDTTITPGSCLGGTNGSITVTASGGNGVYQYSSDGGLTYQPMGTLVVPSGTYPIRVMDGNSCVASLPGVYVGFVNTVTLSTGTGPVICESKSAVLPATTNAVSVLWTPSTALNDPTALNPVASPVVTTTYLVKATTGICDRIDSVTVTVNAAPDPYAGKDTSVCFGGTTKLLASGAMEYAWRPAIFLSDATIPDPSVIRPSSHIKYFLKVKDFNGCESLWEDTVQVYVTPSVKMFAGNDTIVAIGQPLQLSGMQVGGNTVIEYTWSSSYGLNNPGFANPITILDKDITYILTGRTAINCEGSDTVNIKVYKGPEIYVPTVFTPNGDMKNDILKAWAIGMKEYRYFRIYNRWGALVYSSNDFNSGWDGRLKGTIQATGTYVWIAEAVDYMGKVVTRKGTTTLVH